MGCVAQSFVTSGPLPTATPGIVAAPSPHTATTTFSPHTIHLMANRTLINTRVTHALASEPKINQTGLVVSTQRSAFNPAGTVAPADPTAQADSYPNPVVAQHASESGDSRSLSIVFFAVSALLTLATIAVAIVFGKGAAQATQHLINAVITNMREGSRTPDVEMGDLSISPSPTTNVDQTSDYSSVSTAALAYVRTARCAELSPLSAHHN